MGNTYRAGVTEVKIFGPYDQSQSLIVIYTVLLSYCCMVDDDVGVFHDFMMISSILLRTNSKT